MRRKDREVTQQSEIEAVIKACKICHLAMVNEGLPYLVPLNFGYKLEQGQLTLYFHSAKAGQKLTILQKNNQVCFEMETQGHLIVADSPCDYSYDFASIIGFGAVEFIEDSDEKCVALSSLMNHQTGKQFIFGAAQTKQICVYKIVATDYTCKQKKE